MGELQVQSELSGLYTWRVENFTAIDQHKLYSPTFMIGGYTWRLMLCPRGLFLADGNQWRQADYVSLYMESIEAAWCPDDLQPRADMSFTLIKQTGEGWDFTQASEHRWSKEATDWGFTQFIKYHDVINPDKGFLLNDTLKVQVEINVQPNEANPDGHRYCRVLLVTDHDIKQQVGHSLHFDLVDFNKLPAQQCFTLDRTTPFSTFQTKVEELTGVPATQQHYWVWKQRNNRTVRATEALGTALQDQTLTELNGWSRSRDPCGVMFEACLYLQPPSAQDCPAQETRRPRHISLFFKYYDSQAQELSYVGQRLVSPKLKVCELYPLMCELAGLPPGTPLLAFEEAKFDPHCLVMQLQPDQVLSAPGLTTLESGDIICFQTVPPAAADTSPAPAGVTETPAAAAAVASEQDSSGDRGNTPQQQDPAGVGTRTVVDFLQAIAEDLSNAALQRRLQARAEQEQLIAAARNTSTDEHSGSEEEDDEMTPAEGPAPIVQPARVEDCTWLHDIEFLRRRVLEQAIDIANLREDLASEKQETLRLKTENACLSMQLQAAVASAAAPPKDEATHE